MIVLMKRKLWQLVLGVVLLTGSVQSQTHTITEGSFATSSNEVVWTEPAFPTQSDDVKVFFDASQGNAA